MSGPRWKNERGPVFKGNPRETAEDRRAIITEKGFTAGDTVTWFRHELVGDSGMGFLRGADRHEGCRLKGFSVTYMAHIEVPADIIQRGKVVATTWDKKTVSPRNLVKQT